MSYLLGIAAVGIFFLVLHNFTELGNREKGSVTAVLTLLIGAMYLYNVYTDSERDHITAMELKYQQGLNLTCNGIDVNKTQFSYSVGTQTYIGLEGTPHYGRLISASECH